MAVGWFGSVACGAAPCVCMRGNVLSWIRLDQRNRAGGREWQMSSSSWNMKSAARSQKAIPVVVVMKTAAAADTGKWLILVLFCIPPVPAGRHEPKATSCQVFAPLRVLRRGVCACSRVRWFASCASAAFPVAASPLGAAQRPHRHHMPDGVVANGRLHVLRPWPSALVLPLLSPVLRPSLDWRGPAARHLNSH